MLQQSGCFTGTILPQSTLFIIKNPPSLGWPPSMQLGSYSYSHTDVAADWNVSSVPHPY